MNKLSFTIYVTSLCNLDCSYCYEKTFEKQRMSIFTAKEVIDFICKKVIANQCDILEIKFHGGEPLISYDLICYIIEKIEAREECSNVHFKYSMTTNGTLFREEMVELLKRFSSISIRIDGNKETHDKSRIFQDGSGTYEVLKANIIKMLERNINLTARLTVTNQTYQNLVDYFMSILELGIKDLDIQLDFTNSEWDAAAINEYETNMRKVADIIYSLEKEGRKVNLPILTYAKNKVKNSLCDGGITSFTISPEGKVFPCTLAINNPEYSFGYVTEELDLKLLEHLSEIGKQNNEDCLGCSRYDYCATTRCKLINKIYMGNYHSPSPIMCLSENINVKLCKYYLSLVNG